MMISQSWTGCALFKRKVVVISADALEQPIAAGQLFVAPTNGVFMSQGRYLRYRQAINDEILKAETLKR